MSRPDRPETPGTPAVEDPRAAVRAQIREFLSTRRARITPEQAGLPAYDGDRRRVPGLRREETALLVGVSPQYYVRLERGDATGVSPGVVDGLVAALRLDEAEREHLLALLRTAGAPARTRRPGRGRSSAPADPVTPQVRRLLAGMPGIPAVVVGPRLDVLAANPLGRALFAPAYDAALGQGDRRPPNNARYVFLEAGARTFFRDWDVVAEDTVALLRAEAGRHPHDRLLTDLVGELATRSEDFRVRWAAHDVRIHTSGTKRLRHPVVGDLDLPYESLALTGSAAPASLVTYLAEVGTPAHDALVVLASWAATDRAADHPGSDAPAGDTDAAGSARPGRSG